jgi:hypothetical protein
VNEDKSVQAYLKGRKRLVIFDDVEIFLPVERELRAQGTRTAVPHVVDGRAVRSLDTGAGQPSVAQPNPRLSAVIASPIAMPHPVSSPCRNPMIISARNTTAVSASSPTAQVLG